MKAGYGLNKCSANVSAHCELDLLRYLIGPVTIGLALVAEKMGGQAEAGIIGDLVFDACASENGPKIDTARICLGAYIRIGLNLEEHP